ncbi:hypothetical protein GCM10025777_21780 [Membranihabitans marinus]
MNANRQNWIIKTQSIFSSEIIEVMATYVGYITQVNGQGILHNIYFEIDPHVFGVNLQKLD